MRKNENLLDTLLELQFLDRVPRSGYVLRGVDNPESVTEHNWHLAFLVWHVASETEGVDTLGALELALIHDLAEVRTGDLPRTAADYFPEGAKASAEKKAFADLAAPLGDRANDLLGEYQAAATPEARLVKACDKLQLLIKVAAYENWGETGLAEFWHNPANLPGDEFAPVSDLVNELLARVEGRNSR